MQDLQVIIKEIKKQKTYYSKEKKRLKEEISKLPRGTIQKKVISNKPYYYLLYRNKGKIVNEYLGKSAPKELEEQIAERKHLQKELKPVNEALKILNKLKV